MKEKILLLIETRGLFETSKMFDVSIYRILSMIGGVENISLGVMRRFITDVLENVGNIHLGSIGVEPIFVKSNDDEFYQIESLQLKNVRIDIWGGYKLSTWIGEYRVSYDELSDNLIEQIFDVLIDNYEDIISNENG
jgi:hypothetical protein